MDYESIVKGYNKEQKDSIVNFAKLNRDKMHLDNEYHSGALNSFFTLWSQKFPNVKQSKNCKGCRKSVCHFFHNVADFISEDNIKQAEMVVETAKVKTKTKKKVLSKK